MKIQYTKAPYDGVKMQVVDIAELFLMRHRVKRPAGWLTQKLHIYLKGFLERRNRPETAKISQKCACSEHEAGAFTMSALNMMAAKPPSSCPSARGEKGPQNHPQWIL